MPSETIAQRTPISTRSLLILFLRAMFPISQKPLVAGGILDALPYKIVAARVMVQGSAETLGG